MTAPYPFSAVVGLDDLRLALLLTSVSPAVGGVLVRGEKGTAKSTVVRALAGLLPPVTVVPGCRFACAPAAPDPACPDGPHPALPGAPAAAAATVRPASLVELPVGATEDRVVGTLDLQRALTDGVKAYEPGLLAAAHRGVLYVDEVNLLPDHLVDLLLDAAAMGRAHVERDGVSVKHAARFLLVGTMNPEEGEPRPQLVDRFGLVVNVAAPRDARQRAEVVRRRLAYEADPDVFAARYAGAERDYAARIAAARAALPAVTLPDAELDRIARVCLAYGVDGMRADIVVARCAVALAAWHGRDRVTADDVRDAAGLALPHRRRTDPLDPPGTDEQKLEDALAEAERQAEQERAEQERADREQADREQADREQAGQDGRNGGDPDDEPDPDDGGPGGGGPRNDTPRDGGGPSGAGSPHGGTEESTPPSSNDGAPQPEKAGATATAGQAFRTRTLRITARGEGGHAGRRSPAFARRGRVVGSRVPQGKLSGVPHLFATLRAALDRASLDRAALDTITPTHPTPVTRNGTSHDQPSQEPVSQEPVAQDRLSPDRLVGESVAQDRLSPDWLVGESVAQDRVAQDRVAQDRVAQDRDRVAPERLVRGAGSEDQPARERRGGIRVSPRDLRESVHVGREANLVLFVVDASGSMAARKRMTLVKTAVLSLLRDAYQRRDRIGMITFRGRDAEVVLPPTSSHEVGVMRLAALRTGGRTPLAAGLRAAAATIATERRRDPRRRPLLVVVTDGRATSGPDPALLAPALAGVATVVVDCESGPVRLGLAGKLAAVLRADLMPLEHLQSTTVLQPAARAAATASAPADRAYRAASAPADRAASDRTASAPADRAYRSAA
ncbi:VWA domain-containing protein [Actinoplanes hulinensis]|uniref:Mg-protoporphyrin IX chelatase n=1 Tax=Actinoplanes hulinensis TaxID=1144547 RepID=A0ABS7B3J2_9ACTN|nr:VWA domain-containing protein [Actinoplanes hulinensis]MBW6435558.1 VWA domain-containing protein [Actinoplanes hulinensis]